MTHPPSTSDSHNTLSSQRRLTRTLDFTQSGHTRENLAFEKFQRGTAAGGDVAHFLRQTGFFYGGYGVTTTDDGDAALVCR